MTSANAIFIKQFRDVGKNPDVLSQFIIYPVMAFLMTHVIDMGMPGMPESTFVVMFAKMFAGMAFIGAVANVIAEDIERNSLRFLMMAGVKSHEYLLGIGGVFLSIGVIGSFAFGLLMPNATVLQTLTMSLSLVLGVAASILMGAIIGMSSENQQSAVGMGAMLGLLVSFGPFMANMSQNETMMNIFRIFYTMNFVDTYTSTADTVINFGIIIANVLVLALLFTIVYGKHNKPNRVARSVTPEGSGDGIHSRRSGGAWGRAPFKGGAIVSKKAVTAILTIALAVGGGIGGFLWYNAGFVATDDAHVATRMIPVPATSAGVLERFSVQEGQQVNADEILGWVDGGEAMRSPVNGLIIQTNAVQGQRVSPMETVAVISDTSSVHVQANIEETDILNVHVGQRVYVRIDTFGRRQFAGYVTGIGSSATPDNNPMSTSRTTLTIPVEINIADDISLDRLIGVNASVRIPLR